jgi:hypothetical protein
LFDPCCLLQVTGALLSLGDAHAAQGDSELDGTAIETSITGKLRITLHKKAALPKLVQVGDADIHSTGLGCLQGMLLILARWLSQLQM